MTVKPVLVPSAASQDNVTKNRSTLKEDVSGRSDVQKTSKIDDEVEVTTLNDLINALNSINSRSSVYGDQPVTLGGEKVTSISYDDKGLKLVSKNKRRDNVDHQKRPGTSKETRTNRSSRTF